MAVLNGSGEVFLACLFRDDEVRDAEFVEAREESSCVAAIALARSWVASGPEEERRHADVWCGPHCVFDSELIVHFDDHIRARCSPLAPGRYVVCVDEKSSEFTFELVG